MCICNVYLQQKERVQCKRLTAVPELLCCSASFSLLITVAHDAVGIYCGSTSTKSGYHPQMWFSSTKSDVEPTLTAATANKGCGYERNIKRLDNGGILTSLGTFQKILMQGSWKGKKSFKKSFSPKRGIRRRDAMKACAKFPWCCSVIIQSYPRLSISSQEYCCNHQYHITPCVVNLKQSSPYPLMMLISCMWGVNLTYCLLTPAKHHCWHHLHHKYS